MGRSQGVNIPNSRQDHCWGDRPTDLDIADYQHAYVPGAPKLLTNDSSSPSANKVSLAWTPLAIHSETGFKVEHYNADDDAWEDVSDKLESGSLRAHPDRHFLVPFDPIVLTGQDDGEQKYRMYSTANAPKQTAQEYSNVLTIDVEAPPSTGGGGSGGSCSWTAQCLVGPTKVGSGTAAARLAAERAARAWIQRNCGQSSGARVPRPIYVTCRSTASGSDLQTSGVLTAIASEWCLTVPNGGSVS